MSKQSTAHLEAAAEYPLQPWHWQPDGRWRRRARRVVRLRRFARPVMRRATLVAMLGVVVGLIFIQTAQWALAQRDVQKITTFVQQVDREWFSGDHDFRELNRFYARAASEASTIQPFGRPLVEAMQTIRSNALVTQFFPEFSWDQGSADHYETFARGPLHSYFKRNEELAGSWYVTQRNLITEPLQKYGWNAEPPRYHRLTAIFPEDLKRRPGFEHVIDGQLQRLYADLRPPAHLASAESAARLASTDYARVNRQLRHQAQELAFEKNFGSDLDLLTIPQQNQVLADLDDYVRENDLELWRQKQLSDFTLGIIGVPEATNAYINLCAKPFIAARSTFEISGILMTVLFSMLLMHRLMDRWARWVR